MFHLERTMPFDPTLLEHPNALDLPSRRPLAALDLKRAVLMTTCAGVRPEAELVGNHGVITCLFTVSDVYGKGYTYDPKRGRAEQDQERRRDRAVVKRLGREAAFGQEFYAESVQASMNTTRVVIQGKPTGKYKRSTTSFLPTSWAAHSSIARASQQAILGLEDESLMTKGLLECTLTQDFNRQTKVAVACGKIRAIGKGCEDENTQDAYSAKFLAKPRSKTLSVRVSTLRGHARTRMYQRQAPLGKRILQGRAYLHGRELPRPHGVLCTRSGWSYKYRTLNFGTTKSGMRQFKYDPKQGIVTGLLGNRQARTADDLAFRLPTNKKRILDRFVKLCGDENLYGTKVLYNPATKSHDLKVFVRGPVPGRKGMAPPSAYNRFHVAFLDPGQRCTTLVIFRVKTRHLDPKTKAWLREHRAQMAQDGTLTKIPEFVTQALNAVRVKMTPIATFQYDGSELARVRAVKAMGTNSALILPLLGQDDDPRTPFEIRQNIRQTKAAIRAYPDYLNKTVDALTDDLRAYQVSALVIPATLNVPVGTEGPSFLSMDAHTWSRDVAATLWERAHRMGIRVLSADESHTSTTCPFCGAKHPSPELGLWTCASCGLSTPDRDVHGALALAATLPNSRVLPLDLAVPHTWVNPVQHTRTSLLSKDSAATASPQKEAARSCPRLGSRAKSDPVYAPASVCSTVREHLLGTPTNVGRASPLGIRRGSRTPAVSRPNVCESPQIPLTALRCGMDACARPSPHVSPDALPDEALSWNAASSCSPLKRARAPKVTAQLPPKVRARTTAVASTVPLSLRRDPCVPLKRDAERSVRSRTGRSKCSPVSPS